VEETLRTLCCHGSRHLRSVGEKKTSVDWWIGGCLVNKVRLWNHKRR
jgi:hypothetical protein